MKKSLSIRLSIILILIVLGLTGFWTYRSSEAYRKERAAKQTTADLTDREGPWDYEGYTYQYRLEISGRMPNAAKDSTFVYLSNLETISFEQAWKAAGLSSNTADYFDREDAVCIEVKTE